MLECVLKTLACRGLRVGPSKICSSSAENRLGSICGGLGIQIRRLFVSASSDPSVKILSTASLACGADVML